MHFGLSVLRLQPSEFWNTTLRELTVALGPVTAIPRQDFENLMKEHPDPS